MLFSEARIAPVPSAAGGGRVPGVPGVWILIGGDAVLFTLLFGSFMHARGQDVAGFDTGRAVLDFHQGGVNTLLLLTSSWCVVRALQTVRSGRPDLGSRWLAGAALGGLCFAASKVTEYAHLVDQGYSVSTGSFFMYYFTVTGLHLAHVLIGTTILTVLALRLRRGALTSIRGLESVAVYWHLVDALWIVLFPLLYLLR